MQKRNRCWASNWQGLEAVEPRLMLSSDITVAFGALPPNLPTGYTFNVPVTFTNNTTKAISSPTAITLTLRDTGGLHTMVDAKPIALKLAVGGTKTFSIPVTIPPNVRVEVESLEGVLAPISGFSMSQPTTPANIVWQFGNVAGLSGNVACVAMDPCTGNIGTFTLAGPGTGSMVNSGHSSLWDVTLTDTTRATKVTVAGQVDMEAVTASGMVGSFKADQTDLWHLAGFEDSSFLHFDGGILALTLRDFSDIGGGLAHQVVIGNADTSKDTLVFVGRNVDDVNLVSKMPFASFTAAQLVTSGQAENLIQTRGYFGKITVTGNVQGLNHGYAEFMALGSNPATGLSYGSVTIGGNLDAAELSSGHGDVGPVKITGGMSNRAAIMSDSGDLVSVQVGGSVDGDSLIATSYGDIRSISITANLSDGSSIEVRNQGNIGAVTIGQNVNDSIIHCASGQIQNVRVKGDVENTGRIFDDNGDVANVTVEGNLAGGSAIYSGCGNLGTMLIKGSLDHAEIYATQANRGITSVTINGSVGPGGRIETNGYLKTLKVGGSVSGQDSSHPFNISAGRDIGTVTIGGGMSYCLLTSSASMKSISIKGAMANSTIDAPTGGSIGSISVAQLDASAIRVGTACPATGHSSDFVTSSSYLGSLKISGIKDINHVLQCMLNSSAIEVWEIGSIAFGGPSNGSGDLEAKSCRTLKNMPSYVTTHPIS